MGGGDYVEHQNLVSLVPEIALCAIDRIEKLKLKAFPKKTQKKTLSTVDLYSERRTHKKKENRILVYIVDQHYCKWQTLYALMQ